MGGNFMKKVLKLVKNFYFVLIVCTLAVVVSGTSFFTDYLKEQSVKKMALYSPPVYKESETVKKISLPQNEKTENEKVCFETEEIVEPKAKETMSILNDENISIIMPVKGEIINSFTDDNLVYSKTFEDYRVHNGIDISCERSQPVFSVSDGVVEDILTDSLEGITIKINHGNGFQSVYKNLSSDKMVKKGEPVSKGQVISGVGETALFEAAEESHIHFELIYNGKQVNPEIYKEV
jgi:murein DD-endopeptidase MepM/ murein hydrolase activator NlpD